MKFPETAKIAVGSELHNRIRNTWTSMASKLSMEYGIYIFVWKEEENGFLTEYNFKIDDHYFGSLKELRKVLRLKSFM